MTAIDVAVGIAALFVLEAAVAAVRMVVCLFRPEEERWS